MLGKYYFKTGVSAFCEMATADALRILPTHLQPIEVRHQRSILAISAFEYSRSDVGPYQELVLSVVVPPLVPSPDGHPKAGFFPFFAATSTEESRRHRIEHFRFPHYTRNIQVDFVETVGALRVRVHEGDRPIVDFSVTQHEWETTSHLLHTFMMDGEQRLRSTLQLSGHYTVHENERGFLRLYRHPMTAQLSLEEVSPYPFREHWLKEGLEVLHPAEAF